MLEKLLAILKEQRLTWSWAVIVGLFLIVGAHAPILPVVAGGLLAVAISVLRAWPQRPGSSPARGA